MHANRLMSDNSTGFLILDRLMVFCSKADELMNLVKGFFNDTGAQ